MPRKYRNPPNTPIGNRSRFISWLSSTNLSSSPSHSMGSRSNGSRARSSPAPLIRTSSPPNLDRNSSAAGLMTQPSASKCVRHASTFTERRGRQPASVSAATVSVENSDTGASLNEVEIEVMDEVFAAVAGADGHAVVPLFGVVLDQHGCDLG